MQHRSSSQVLHPQPTTALALELCCHMGNQRNCTFFNQLCLKNNWTHMVLPHLLFSVSFTSPSCGHAWSQASSSHLQHELLLLLPSPGHCSQTSYRDPYNSCSKDLDPSSWHKAQPDPGPRAGSNTGPSAAPGKLVWVTWLWVKVHEQEILNKNCPCSCSPSPVKVSNAVHSTLAARSWCP